MQRLNLWEDLYQVAYAIDRPWLIGGNFNIVLNVEEKIGGLPILDTSKGNPGPSSTAFCVRDYNGNLVGAKGVKLVDSSNLMAQAIAIREGLQYCLDKHFQQIIIETDSLSMVNILNGEWESPWSVTMEVNSINRIRNSISVIMSSILSMKSQQQLRR
ncbi:hypothetical protein KY285_035997 [Solanum tuberosum]|nr:hypothetical protein KY285_035997 [Solanum tuberosum]